MPTRDYLSVLPDPRRVPAVARCGDALAGHADELAGGFRRSGSAGPHDLLLECADLVVIRHGD